jgi:hypothetical protein
VESARPFLFSAARVNIGDADWSFGLGEAADAESERENDEAYATHGGEGESV